MKNREEIYNYVAQFRHAIEEARTQKELLYDVVFSSFPNGCCGDTCYLLAEYLRINDIETIYVCGEEEDQSHAWLVVKDELLLTTTLRKTKPPEDIKSVWSFYGGKNCEEAIVKTNYTERDIAKGLVIDITADQFGQAPIYVDYLGAFHKRFDFVEAYDCDSLRSYRLREIFQTIMEYIYC